MCRIQCKRGFVFHLSESPQSNDPRVAELDDGTPGVTATVVDSDVLEWWLRGVGAAIGHVRRVPAGLKKE